MRTLRTAALPISVALTSIALVLLAAACHAADATRDAARTDTLWIFDADFEDLVGANAGWTTEDRSGTSAIVNYWHRDTLRPCPRPVDSPGTVSWWCGTYDPCWRQPRGYGNDWTCRLERDFPLASWSTGGDEVSLVFDQRFAMERLYDYGYVDVSTDGGQSWATHAVYSNRGFSGAGVPVDWDDVDGHEVLDLSVYAGVDVRVRYRFESDMAYSSQDEYDNSQHSVLDGAWQLDNIEWSVNDVTVWTDDCEGSGDNGWEHADIPAAGQTGVTFFRGQLGTDLWTNRPPYPGEPPTGTWMMGAVAPATSRMVDDQSSWLVSPPIDVAGAPVLVGEYRCWVDFPGESNDAWDLYLASGDAPECIQFHSFPPNPPLSGPEWVRVVDDWGVFAGSDWLKIAWATVGGEPEAGHEHMAGLLLDRVRVGVPLLTDVPDDEVVATGLSRVYPNPFAPAATIEYALPRRAHVVVRVVDPSGRVVATLFDAPAGPGTSAVTWDGTTDAGRRAASGVYFVKLEAAGETSAKKVVLLK